uniref:Protein kinase domain-containing protein n=1 Tax=Leersia perrieri TaxID=77586 RepID=A0A0D9UZT3_9ORYZ
MKPIFLSPDFVVPPRPAKPFFSPHDAFLRLPPPGAAARDEVPDLDMSDFDVVSVLHDGFYDSVHKVRLRHAAAADVAARSYALKIPYFEDILTTDEAATSLLRRVDGLDNVVRCHAVFRGHESSHVRSTLFELMNGGSLERVMDCHGGERMPEAAVAEVAASCLTALEGIHSLGVVHLNLTPSNILADDDGNVKICDFTMARLIPPPGPESFVFLGGEGLSLAYLSPERRSPMAMAGTRGAWAADVWSLGVVVAELCLGYRPHSSQVDDGGEVLDGVEFASVEMRGFVSACLQKCVCTRATVAQLLNHPFVADRDAVESRRVLKEFVVSTMEEEDY